MTSGENHRATDEVEHPAEVTKGAGLSKHGGRRSTNRLTGHWDKVERCGRFQEVEDRKDPWPTSGRRARTLDRRGAEVRRQRRVPNGSQRSEETRGANREVADTTDETPDLPWRRK